MAVQKQLITSILESLKKAENLEVQSQEIYTSPEASTGKNEFLFFVKPEVLDTKKGVKTPEVLELILNRISEFGLKVQNVKLLSADYLEKYNVIAQHYGVINSIARNALENMSEGAKEKFAELFGVSPSEAKVLGGLQVLDEFPHLNAFSLDYLWQNLNNQKLAGGTYAEEARLDGETVYIVNGFHPRQLRHFTEKGRSIVVMTLTGDLDWSVARNEFVGATNPANAKTGSIRRSLLDAKETLGLAEVGQGTNGVHLSAGPVEALVELRRYNSDFSTADGELPFEAFSFGRTLKAELSDHLATITDNGNVTVDGKSVSIFDLTEEKNSEEALQILKRVFGA